MRTRATEIRQRRRLLGLTQEQLAAQAALDVKTVRKAEKSGQNVDLRVIVALADQLQAAPQELIEPDTISCPPPELLIELVKRWNDLYIQADIDGLVKMHTADTIFELPEKDGLPRVRDCEGIDQLEQVLRETLPLLRVRGVDSDTEQYHASGNLVFMRVNAHMEFIPTGDKFKARHVNEFEFEGELIKRRVTIADHNPLRKILAELDDDFSLGGPSDKPPV